ncbi:hypothetical protein [Vibrio penaeicida]|uniref:Uncharacterized protein n=1 Tax=Vibrio penaeicida TaxID=104609 RepID=A0AAV5NTE3_9VIBR|nr:hypothetical protein [Vibrio penaeicida]RTZ22286.1 hypothetical protein EKN09_14865 [Vibrio penaeicida]GLQ73277.1 hypothetical protein GCM10007932_26370 [Vibrio penaeicida]
MGRNWDYAKQRGREQRLEAESKAIETGVKAPLTPPLFSHDATLQSYFSKAWHRTSQQEINRHLGLVETPQGNDLISKIRSLKECHFQSSRG